MPQSHGPTNVLPLLDPSSNRHRQGEPHIRKDLSEGGVPGGDLYGRPRPSGWVVYPYPTRIIFVQPANTLGMYKICMMYENLRIYGSVSLGTPPPSYGIPPPCGVGGVVVVEVLVVRIRVVIVVEVEVVVGVQVEVEVVVIVLVLLVLRSSNVSSSSSRSTSRSVEVQVQVEVEVQVVVIQ